MCKRILFSFLFLILAFIIKAQESPDVVITTGHNEMIHAMAVSENGEFLASSSNDRMLKIWNISMGLEYRTITDHSGRILDLDFSKNNKWLAGTSSNEELLIWDYVSGEIAYQGTCSSSSQVHFYQDDKYLLYTGSDATLYSYDMNKKTSSKVPLEGFVMQHGVDSKNNMLYAFTVDKQLVQWDLKAGEEGFRIDLSTSDLIPFTKLVVSPSGEYVMAGFTDLKFRVFDTKKKALTFTSEVQGTGVLDISFDYASNVAYVLQHQGDILQFNCQKNEGQVISMKSHEYDFGTTSATAFPEKNIHLFANYNRMTLYDAKEKAVIREITSGTAEIFEMAYDPMGRYLAVSTGSEKFMDIWDLKSNKIKGNIPAFFPTVFTKDGKQVIASQYPKGLTLFDVETEEEIRSFDTGMQLVQSSAISPDGKVLAAAGFTNEIYLWEVETGNRIGSLKGHTGGVVTLDFHPTKPYLASSGYDATLKVWNYKELKEIKSFNDQTIRISEVAFSPDGKELASGAWDHSVVIYSTETWNITKRLKNVQNQLDHMSYSHDGKYLIVTLTKGNGLDSRNRVVVWDLEKEVEKCRFEDHSASIVGLASEIDSYRYFSASTDGQIHLNDFEKCEQIATYLAFGSSDFMVYTPDNYFMTSSGTARSIAFRRDEELLPFEQFDLYLNRPDIVAERIGKSTPNLLKAYRYLYERKLKKMNLDEGSLKLDYQVPFLKITSEYDFVTSEKEIRLTVVARDDKYDLERIDVRVNEVPIFGRNGVKIPDGKSEYTTEIVIPLLVGINKIRISAFNEMGVRSLIRQGEVVRRGNMEENDLYILSIGVSDYKESAYDLKYPRIDAEEVKLKFENDAKNYRKVYTELIVDQEVSRENVIAKGEAFFRNCSYEDVAIIFIAGHGVLDENFDYYFGTHDMSFTNPGERGLPYDELSRLLEKISAYQKLLIMDTCHSGELDSDQYKKGESVESESGDIKFRAVGEEVANKNGVDFENLMRVTDNIFSYSEEGSGATIIASAGGAEFAMESDEWQNGLFTFAFLEGLENQSADLNRNQRIELSEIQEYVHKKVKRLSNGMQIPTARSENISRDYSIFGVK